MATKKKPAKKSDVTLSPDLPLYPGNMATFTARQGNGRVEAQVATNRDTTRSRASNTSQGASVSKLIETDFETVTVTFYEDDTEYASGTFTVG